MRIVTKDFLVDFLTALAGFLLTAWIVNMLWDYYAVFFGASQYQLTYWQTVGLILLVRGLLVRVLR